MFVEMKAVVEYSKFNILNTENFAELIEQYSGVFIERDFSDYLIDVTWRIIISLIFLRAFKRNINFVRDVYPYKAINLNEYINRFQSKVYKKCCFTTNGEPDIAETVKRLIQDGILEESEDAENVIKQLADRANEITDRISNTVNLSDRLKVFTFMFKLLYAQQFADNILKVLINEERRRYDSIYAIR